MSDPQTFQAIESFPFGDISLSCVSSPPLGKALIVQRVAVTPKLPDGMAVDLVTAYRIAFELPAPVHGFSFEFTRVQCETKGDGEWGECRDA